MEFLVRSLFIAALLALCWSLWQFLLPVLQAAPLSFLAPIVALAAIILLLTVVEWAHQKFHH